MDRELFSALDGYMRSCMGDSAHDVEHVYRVLYYALDIAEHEQGVDLDVLICACMLHDIGRKEQFDDPSLCHAEVGGDKAYAFLTARGFPESFAESVRACIRSHRFRKDRAPAGTEAKILFDADKLDVTGAVGIARTLVYRGDVNEPLYTLDEQGMPSNGVGDTRPSFFSEYHYKLEKLYDKFYTERGKELAALRRPCAAAFYDSLYAEVSSAYSTGKALLKKAIE
ncbi:MAG: HD domain-containing protein [Roseburia sp.]|nr:HD domain-containing protein [Roseburia sp.]